MGIMALLICLFAADRLEAQGSAVSTLRGLDAETLLQQGKPAEAEPLMKRALAIWEGLVGPNDVRVAGTLSNLAKIYKTEGKYAEAEPLLKRSLAILENTRGPKSPELATDLESYADLLRKMGRNPEAIEVEARAKGIRAEPASASPPKRDQ